jgi:dolichol-phosphate mannosyltransferase
VLKITIVIPTYNEATNIEPLLTAIKNVSESHDDVCFSILVIDDSSPDGTADVVGRATKSLKSRNFSIDLAVRKEKNGLGRAYMFAFKKILKDNTSDYIFQMDADMSHNPTYITAFITQIRQGADFVAATRYRPGGATPDWSWYRKFLSRGGNIYARMVLGNKLTDYTGGYNAYSADLLKAINIDTLTGKGYGFQIELKYKAINNSKKIAEVPIIFLDRQQGNSKMPTSTILKNFILVSRMRYGEFKKRFNG